MKKRVSKKVPSKGTYKKASLSKITFENTRRTKPYTVKRIQYELRKGISVNNKTKSNIEKTFGAKIRQAGNKFYKKHAKNSKKVFLPRVGFTITKGKKKIKSGFSLRTRKTSTKKQFDEMIDDFIGELVKAMEGYVKGTTNILIKNFQIDVEQKSGKSRAKSKAIPARRKSAKKRR